MWGRVAHNVRRRVFQDAIARGVAGIAISPTDSSTAPSVLALAARAKIPVVVADIDKATAEASAAAIVAAGGEALVVSVDVADGELVLDVEQAGVPTAA